MILKNVKFGLHKQFALMRFRDGDIAVVNGLNKKQKHATVFFKNIEPGKVNRDVEFPGEPGRKTSDDFEPQVSMVFENVESLDVVMEAMKRARQDLVDLKKKV